MKKKLWILWCAVALWAVVSTVWVFLHRRVIRAAIRREAYPACPHWLPGCVLEMLADTGSAQTPKE